MTDKHYTPAEIAEKLVGSLGLRPKLIADFAAGEGALLKAARARWPASILLGTDLNASAVEKIKKLKRLKAQRCDFLSERSRERCILLERNAQAVDLVVLNPPFSCRGARHKVDVDGDTFSCSKAMAFVINSTRYLRSSGVIAAILPSSCMTSERDFQARKWLSNRFELRWGEVSNSDQFAGCSVSVVFMYLAKGKGEVRRESKLPGIVTGRAIDVKLIRGKQQMDTIKRNASRGGTRLVHTTDLTDGVTTFNKYRSSSADRAIAGPALLIPRVGKFDAGKICVIRSRYRFVLSDCVFALEATSLQQLTAVRDRILQNEDLFRRSYSGSCAKYISIAGLQSFLRTINVRSTLRDSDKDRSAIEHKLPVAGYLGIAAE